MELFELLTNKGHLGAMQKIQKQTDRFVFLYTPLAYTLAALLYAVGLDIFEVGTIEKASHWILVVTTIGLICFQLISTLNIVTTVRGSTSRHAQDISAENRPPTPKAARLIQELNGLGFTQLGETLVPLPLIPKGVPSWILTSFDGTDTVEVTDLGRGLPAMLQFTTVFADEAALETTYPQGVTQDFPMFRGQFNITSPIAAYQQHLQACTSLQAQHGTPLPFQNMTEYLRWDRRYRELHIQQRLAGASLLSLIRLLWLLAYLPVVLFLNLAESNPALFSDDVKHIVLYSTGVLLPITGFLVLMFNKTHQRFVTDLAKAHYSEPK